MAVAWPLAERLMRAEGRGDEADEIIRRAAEMKNSEVPDEVIKQENLFRG